MRNNCFTDDRLRPEIAQSWTRAAMCGLTPATVHHAEDDTVDPDGALARCAFPILDDLRDVIGAGRIAFMMTDRAARLIKTVHTDSSLARAMSTMGAEVGTVWSEERTGTNALATPFATREPIFIHGEEHFVVPMKAFSCYGAPIFDPVTGHVEGVLDVMMDASAESPLMAPVVDQAIRNIQRELQAHQTDATRELATAFTSASARTGRPVIAFGPKMVLTSRAAAKQLTTTDIDQLCVLASSVPLESSVSATLHSGSHAKVTVNHQTSAGTVFTVGTTDRAPIPRGGTKTDASAHLTAVRAEARAADGSLVVVGEAGSGRSTVARAAVSGHDVRELHGSALGSEQVRWELLNHRESHRDQALLIEDCEQLTPGVLRLLTEIARTSPTRVVATYDQTHEPRNDIFLARFHHRIDTRPLRELANDLPGVIRAVKPQGTQYQFDASAIKAMAEYGWPGNLSELRSALMSLADLASTRTIRFSDLPLHIRQGTQRSFTPWQRASRDAILHALEVNRDNKSHAAEFLGISRSSLYHHMRELGLN